jgi:hypothetical protein
MGNARHLHIHSESRFVMHGLIYVSSALVFMSLAVSSGIILGSRVTEFRTLSFGVAGIALLFVLSGNVLLASFLLRRWRSQRKPATWGGARWSRDVWDDHLDGPDRRWVR